MPFSTLSVWFVQLVTVTGPLSFTAFSFLCVCVFKTHLVFLSVFSNQMHFGFYRPWAAFVKHLHSHSTLFDGQSLSIRLPFTTFTSAFVSCLRSPWSKSFRHDQKVTAQQLERPSPVSIHSIRSFSVPFSFTRPVHLSQDKQQANKANRTHSTYFKLSTSIIINLIEHSVQAQAKVRRHWSDQSKFPFFRLIFDIWSSSLASHFISNFNQNFLLLLVITFVITCHNKNAVIRCFSVSLPDNYFFDGLRCVCASSPASL